MMPRLTAPSVPSSRPRRPWIAALACAALAWLAPGLTLAAPDGVELRETGGSETRFTVTVPEPVLTPLPWAADVQSLALSGYSIGARPGETALPARILLIAIPPAGEVTLEVRAGELATQEGVLPATQPVIPSGLRGDPFADPEVRESMLGNRDRRGAPAAGPAGEAPWAELAGTGWMREQRVARVVVRPSRYDPAARRLVTARTLELVVRSTGGAVSRPAPSAARRPTSGAADPFEEVYQGVLVNPEQGRAWRAPPPATGAGFAGAAAATVVPDTSVYAGRTWVKLAIPQTGFYKVSFAQLRATGLFNQRTDVPLDSLRLFTWPGYPVLPEGTYCDSCDYREVAIQVVDSEPADGEFNVVGTNSDYIYFFALGPSDWGNVYDPSRPHLEFVNNPYEINNYYFLTFGTAASPVGGTPRRIATRNGTPGDPAGTTTPATFLARAHFEQDNEYEVDAAPADNPPGARFDVSSTRDTLFWEKWFWASVKQGNEFRTEALDVPGLDATQPIRLRARFWGLMTHRSHSIPDHVMSAYLNDVPILTRSWNWLLPQTVDTTMIAPVANGFQIRMVVPRVTDPLYDFLRNDRVGFAWFDIFYQRRFEPVGDALLIETAGGGSYIYDVGPFRAPADSMPRVFDVTDPLAPVEVLAVEYLGAGSAWRLRFRSDENEPRRYRILPERDFRNVPTTAIANAAQTSLVNLRGSSRKADYLLIYHDTFETAAQALLTWRNGHLPMAGRSAPFDTASVPVSALFDQFSGGRQDPTAIRNFLRAVFTHWRADGHAPPTYVTMLGDGSSDFKNITGNVPAGTTGPFVPSYEGGWDYQVKRQFGSDDWLLNVDNPDVVVPDFYGGRVPVREPAEAMAYVRDKLIPYESTAPLGLWRNEVMLIADDNKQGASNDPLMWEHVRQTARLDVAGTAPHVDRLRVYLHKYETQSLTKPDARRAIKAGIDEGVVMVNYIGHGSPFQLADERVYVQGDAQSQSNARRPTVFVAASCDVGKFNDPVAEAKSIGELLVLNPAGGAVGVISATELAFSNQNADLNLTLYREIFRRDTLSGRYRSPLAAGLLRAKLFGSTNNQKYQLMGDAGVRLLLPHDTVELTFVDTAGVPDSVALRGYPLRFNGRILDRPGGTLRAVDGDLDLLIEDSAPIENVDGTDYPYQASPIFRGTVQVRGGVFSGQCVVPVDARAGTLGRGRGYLFGASGAYDADAAGSHGLAIQAAPPPIGDNEGPRIALSFPGGSTTVRPDAVLRIDVSDDNGVLITGNTPQNGIIVTIDESSTNRFDATATFRYATNSYRAGTAFFTLPNLAPGTHTIRVSAADNLAGGINAAQHRTSATITFTVSENPALRVVRAFLFPNPTVSGGARGGGTFIVDVPGDSVNVLVRVYTVAGRLIRTLTHFGSLGQVQIPWDGLDAEGDRLANGVYLFRVHVNPRDPDGASSPRQRATAEGRVVIVGH